MKKLQFVRLDNGNLYNIFSIDSVSPIYPAGNYFKFLIRVRGITEELYFATSTIAHNEKNKIISAIEKFGTVHG
jgi:hypothetical protein